MKKEKQGLTQNAELDGLAQGQFPQELARLEGERLLGVLAETGSRDVGKGERLLSAGVVGVGENEGVAAEHRLDVGVEDWSHGDDKDRLRQTSLETASVRRLAELFYCKLPRVELRYRASWPLVGGAIIS